MLDAVGVHVMPYTCRGCSRTFSDELDRDLHAERCVENTLRCRGCGESFDE
jgi:DNA-directed RNA polymerase subunit RPC12/RpoP